MSPAEPLRVLDGGRAPHGWEALWGKDVWAQHELPHGDLASMYRGTVYLHFGPIRQPWLKEAAKRWTRARLLGDTTPRTMSSYLTDLRHFSAWLAESAPEVTAPGLLSRAVLEDYLLWVRHSSPWAPATRQRRVISLRGLLEEQAQDGLAGLGRGAKIYGAEIPRVDYRLPKELEGDVFGQWVSEANLQLLEDEQHRTIVLLLAYTGFRVSSVVTLPRRALQIGPDGHPYLRYLNIKSKREAMLPVPPQLAEQLERQEAHLRRVHGDQTEWLLASPPKARRGNGGGFHVSHGTVGRVVKAYVRKAQIRGRDGQLALEVHPHLFRHHVGTSMVNDGVSLMVIQKVLDHGSMEMTAHYARLHDETLKREVLRWHERVNRRGERIALPAAGPLEEAAWMKERIARARQALPNGYCGLPLVQTCPHPNACLSCDSFLTDGSFRAVHEHHKTENDQLLKTARERERPPDRGARARRREPHPHPGGPRRDRCRPPRPRRARPRRARSPDDTPGVRLMAADPARKPLADAAARRTLDAEKRVRGALRDLDHEGASISFAAVAQRAQVSRAFLYSHADFRAEIEALRAARGLAPARLPVRQRAGDASLRTRLRAALQDNQRLREELTRMREELAIAHGRVRELELDRRSSR